MCDCVLLPDGHYSIILDGAVFDWRVDLDGDSCSIVGRDGNYTLRIIDPRRMAHAKDVAEGQEGLQRITADMPGKVVRVLVEKDETVNYDQGLLVLEAMKMQNEIRAPKNGTVKEIGVTEGMAVNSGDFLVSLE
jgi:acetyl/propionyl-CoA carboxylase alpha subunit